MLVELPLILLPLARIVLQDRADREHKQQQARDRKPLVKGLHLVEPVAALFDVVSRDLLCRCRYGRLLVSALLRFSVLTVISAQ